MTAHILDRPVWNTLATRHARFAVGGDRARRFAADVGPLAGARDDEPDSLAELAGLVPIDGTLLLLQADPVVLPPSLAAVTTAIGVQMVLDRLADVRSDAGIVPLTADDGPAMLELATLTRPGPFGPRAPANVTRPAVSNPTAHRPSTIRNRRKMRSAVVQFLAVAHPEVRLFSTTNARKLCAFHWLGSSPRSLSHSRR